MYFIVGSTKEGYIIKNKNNKKYKSIIQYYMASQNDLATTNLWSFIALFMAFFVYLCFQILSGQRIEMKDIYYTIFIFYILTFIVQVSSNAYLTSRKEICGKTDMGVSFSSTIYPWLFIYGLTIILIITIPGWLRVFSNTFGLYCAKAYGLNELLTQKIFIKPSNPTPTTQSDLDLLKTIDSVYNDPSLLINELDPRDCDIQYNDDKEITNINWASFQKIITSGITTFNLKDDPNKLQIVKELYDKMVLKETVGFSVWIFLSGVISVIVSTNILLNTGCKKNLASNYDIIFKS